MAGSNTKERIQAVARQLFVEQGIQKTSLQQIADRLGITKPALYYHFTSRDELVLSIIQPLVREMESFVEERAPRSEDLLSDYFGLVWRHRDVIGMMVRELATLSYEDLGVRMFAWRRQLIELLVGPELTAERQIHATVALGGMSDCCVEYAHLPFEEVRTAAVAAAARALDLP